MAKDYAHSLPLSLESSLSRAFSGFSGGFSVARFESEKQLLNINVLFSQIKLTCWCCFLFFFKNTKKQEKLFIDFFSISVICVDLTTSALLAVLG